MDYKEHYQNLAINYDNLAQYEPHTWGHNTRYLPSLLKGINPAVGGIAVDVFCQRGDLVRTLSSRFSHVIGIDLSPKMIEIAKEKSEGYENVTFVCDDFMSYDIPDNSCGLITMVASLHHLPTEEAIAKAKRCLKRSGRLIIIDMYRPDTLYDVLLSMVSQPLNSIGQILFEKHKTSPEEMSHWRVHASLDCRDTVTTIKALAKEYLPDAKIVKRLFWRYTLVWIKP